MNRPRLHLRAACTALLIVATGLLVVMIGAPRFERRAIRALAPETSHLKNQGRALQRAVFASPDVLPLYGSSELLKRIPDRASVFFSKYPTRFAVSPTGRAGCTSLIMLQKIAASASSMQGHKVAIILSPSWFIVPPEYRRGYAGNFSLLQARHLIFGRDLSWELKRDIARRLLDYPQTVDKSGLLATAASRAADGDRCDRLVVAALRPMGLLDNVIGDVQDHLGSCWASLKRGQHSVGDVESGDDLPWNELLEQADGKAKPVNHLPDSRPRWFANDADFRQLLDQSQEWGDLELLLRTLRELRLDPLVITIPIERRHFEEMGISKGSVEAYEQRLSALTARYRVPLAAFADHEEDDKFFFDHHDHLSVKGWMYVDKTLNAFYHAPRRHFRPHKLPVEDFRSKTS